MLTSSSGCFDGGADKALAPEIAEIDVNEGELGRRNLHVGFVYRDALLLVIELRCAADELRDVEV
jgi:hypothetical protein